MAASTREKNNGKSRWRTIRFGLYAVVLIGALLLLWHEREKRNAENEDEIISAFIDSADAEVEGIVADVLLEKAMRTFDPGEKAALCDRVIERYRDSADGRAVSAVLRAHAMKAEVTGDNAAKLKILTDAIERYSGSSDFLVQMELKRMYAAKAKAAER